MNLSFRVSAMAVGLSAAGAFAGPTVTINLGGTVSSGWGGIATSSAVSASVTYDTSLTPTGGSGVLRFFATSTLNSFTIDGFNYTGSGGRQTVFNNNGSFDVHQHFWTTIGGSNQGGLIADNMVIQGVGGTSILSTPTQMPTAAQQSLFTSYSGYILFVDAGATQFESANFNFTSIEVIDNNPAVPLPTGAAMAMVGMGVIGIRRRRS